MSLVGAEVDVSSSHSDRGDSPVPDDTPSLRSPASHPFGGALGGVTRSESIESVEDLHPSISPKGSAEALFLGSDLETSIISATALAQQIHQAHRGRTSQNSLFDGGTTIATEDFQSCAGDAESVDLIFTAASLSSDIAQDSPFGKDALAHSREPIPTESETVYHDTSMTAATDSSSNKHPDAAEKVYECAKNVWGWGKGVMILSPFLGLAEGVAGKVIEIATGNTLSDVDSGLQKNLGTVDEKYLNPAIERLIQVLLGTVSKVSFPIFMMVS